VSACTNRLSSRLEASLLAGLVLVNFSMNYLDLKLLMDELGYVISQILIPVIKLYSNMKLKFPNGYLMRQALAFKTLDIILILSLRIGLEQTRILMKEALKFFFDSFSQVRFNIMNPSVFPSKPIQIKSESKFTSKASFLKPRVSIMSFNQRGSKQELASKDLLASDEDDYLKVSVDLSNNSVGKGIELSSSGTKFRTQSFGLLSLNNEDDSDQPSNTESHENAFENSTSSFGSNEEMINTFTCELAHTAYLGICRLTSGNYIDNILSNGDLIHKMCLLNEQASKQS
ncbi:WD repeat-containing 81-like, partial [Brachionus plicatilis]